MPLAKTYLVVVTGQSLAAGTATTASLSVAQWATGQCIGGSALSATGNTTMLVESGRTESPWTAAGYQADALLRSRGDNIMFVSNAQGSTEYDRLKKGSSRWKHLTTQLDRVKVSKRNNTDIIPLAICCVHGESDQLNQTWRDNYKSNLIQWRADISDLVAERLELPRVEMSFVACQVSSFSWYAGAGYGSLNQPTTSLSIVDLAKEQPSKFISANPKYHLPTQDGVHFTSASSRMHGGQHGKILAKLIAGQSVTSFVPESVSAISATVYRIQFRVPVAPLVFDTTVITTVPNQGFTCNSNNGVTVSSVAIASSGTAVDVTLSSSPTGTSKAIRYAWTAPLSSGAGPTTGPRGHLRDSDATKHVLTQDPLYNWCPHFTIPLP